MKKPVFYTELAYPIALLLLALGTALTAYGGFGISMVVAPAYILHLRVSELLPFFSFGVAEYTLQAVILLLLIAVRCGNNVLLKFYKMDTAVTDISSMFIFTNVFQALTSLVPLIAYVIKKRSTEELRTELADARSIFRLIPILAIIGSTSMSNVVSLISAELIGVMDISLYTPTVSAIGMISGVIASFIYRERHGVLFYVSASIALIAVII